MCWQEAVGLWHLITGYRSHPDSWRHHWKNCLAKRRHLQSKTTDFSVWLNQKDIKKWTLKSPSQFVFAVFRRCYFWNELQEPAEHVNHIVQIKKETGLIVKDKMRKYWCSYVHKYLMKSLVINRMCLKCLSGRKNESMTHEGDRRSSRTLMPLAWDYFTSGITKPWLDRFV